MAETYSDFAVEDLALEGGELFAGTLERWLGGRGVWSVWGIVATIHVKVYEGRGPNVVRVYFDTLQHGTIVVCTRKLQWNKTKVRS